MKKTDWSRAAVESDAGAAPLVDEAWFEEAEVVEPATKTAFSIRIDREVLEYFKASSRRYQTKINAVLRAYMEHERSKR